MIVYKATNLVNGKGYVGITAQPLEKRMVQHKSRSATLPNALYGAIRKHGWGAFKWEILKTCSTREELLAAEQGAIREHNTRADGGWGYNRTEGGEGTTGLVFSAESRRKLSQKATGRVKSVATRLKLSLALRGRKPVCSRKGVKASDETRARIRANHVGRLGQKNTPEMNAALLAGRLAVAKMKPQCAADVAVRRLAGESFAQIGRRYGAKASTVFYFCKRQGIPA